MYVQKRGGEIDFAALRAQMRSLGLEGMLDALLEICRQWLSLPDRALVWRGHAGAGRAGAAGGYSQRRRVRQELERAHALAAVVYRSFESADGDKGRLLRALFPSAGR